MIQIRTHKFVLYILSYLQYIFFGIFILIGETSFAQGKLNKGIAGADGWSLGLNVSTYGPGLELSRHFSRNAVLKLAYNYLPYTYPLAKLDEELEGNADFMTGGLSLLVHYYFLPRLYLSGGVTYNQTNLVVDGQMAESVFIGDIEMYPDEVGTVHLEINPEYNLAPYLGFGYGYLVPAHSRMSLGVELGMIYLGKPQVALHTTGMLEPTATEGQKQLIEDNIAALKYLPVVTFRVAYKLGGSK